MERVKFRSLLLWIACFTIAATVSWIYHIRDIPFRGDRRHQFFIAERAASGIPPHVNQFSAKHSWTSSNPVEFGSSSVLCACYENQAGRCLRPLISPDDFATDDRRFNLHIFDLDRIDVKNILIENDYIRKLARGDGAFFFFLKLRIG